MSVESQMSVVKAELDWPLVMKTHPELKDVPENERAIVAYKCMNMSDSVIAEITGLQLKTVQVVIGRWPACLTAKRDEFLRRALVARWVDDGLMNAAVALQRADVGKMGPGELSRHVKCLLEIKNLVKFEERKPEEEKPKSVAELAKGLA